MLFYAQYLIFTIKEDRIKYSYLNTRVYVYIYIHIHICTDIYIPFKGESTELILKPKEICPRLHSKQLTKGGFNSDFSGETYAYSVGANCLLFS